MKKVLLLTLSLIIVFVLLFALAGCNIDLGVYRKNKSDNIVGKWRTTIDVSEAMRSVYEQDEEFGKYINIDEFPVLLQFEFYESGSYIVTVDRDALEAEVNELMEKNIEALRKNLEDIIESEGLDMTLEELEEESGLDMRSRIEETYSDYWQYFSCYESTGRFKTEGNKLYMSYYHFADDEYIIYELDGNKLTFTEAVTNNDEYIGVAKFYKTKFPMELKRVK